MQQLGLFDAPVEQDGPQSFAELAQEYLSRMALATDEVEIEAYDRLSKCAIAACPVNAVVRSMYLCTKITHRYYGERRGQRAIYLQEFLRFLAVQQNDPHPVATETTLEAVFAAGRDGAFQYRGGDPVLVWRNKVWRGDEESLVLSHLSSDSHQVIASLDEVENSGEWIVC